MNPMPFQPEPLNALKARYAKALAPVFNFMDTQIKPAPGMKREHVFDFENGLRMIASREYHGQGKTYLHLSFGVVPEKQSEWNAIRHHAVSYDTAWEFLGDIRPPDEEYSTKRAIHFFFLT